MLCNRPTESGQPKVASSGVQPFKSVVTKGDPLGWGPTQKLKPRNTKKKIDPNGALAKHK